MNSSWGNREKAANETYDLEDDEEHVSDHEHGTERNTYDEDETNNKNTKRKGFKPTLQIQTWKKGYAGGRTLHSSISILAGVAVQLGGLATRPRDGL